MAKCTCHKTDSNKKRCEIITKQEGTRPDCVYPVGQKKTGCVLVSVDYSWTKECCSGDESFALSWGLPAA